MKTLDVSIIIVNWNTKNFLRDCLSSIIHQTKNVHYEIILIDNASTDYSAEMVEDGFPDIKLIRNDQNLGFAVANNQGMKIANYRSFKIILIKKN